MTFRERLEQYKQGGLDEAARRELEEAIDREDAILEYLSEREEIPALDDAGEAGPPRDEALEARFSAELSRRIRRAFTRLGLCVGAVLLALLLLTQFVLPHVVDWFYYDPGQIVAKLREEHEEPQGVAYLIDAQTNRMSLDMAVYSELFLPGAYRENVEVMDRGYGEYDIVIVQNVGPTGLRLTDVAGHISKGRLMLYDANLFKPPVANALEWGINMPDPARSLTEQIRRPETDENGVTTCYAMGIAGYPEDARAYLETLPDGQLYQGFVSLDRPMDYDSFYALLQREETGSVWCAVQLSERPGYAVNWGFCTDYGNGGNLLCWDQNRYPLLKRPPFATGEDLLTLKTGEQARQHLESLLRYWGDQKRFRAMMGDNAEDPAELLRYLEEHGVWVYGFSLTADKETLLRLQDCPEVYSVAAEPLR